MNRRWFSIEIANVTAVDTSPILTRNEPAKKCFGVTLKGNGSRAAAPHAIRALKHNDQ